MRQVIHCYACLMIYMILCHTDQVQCQCRTDFIGATGATGSTVTRGIFESTFLSSDFAQGYLDCGPVPTPPKNSRIYLQEREWTGYGSLAFIICDDGFELVPMVSNTISCDETCRWSPPILSTPYCRPSTCLPLPSLPRGATYILREGQLNLGSTVEIECKEGYASEVDQSYIMRCDQNGTWQPSLPSITCIATRCPDLPAAPDNTLISYSQGDGEFTSTVSISCAPGYQLIPMMFTSLTCNACGFWSPDITGLEFCQPRSPVDDYRIKPSFGPEAGGTLIEIAADTTVQPGHVQTVQIGGIPCSVEHVFDSGRILATTSAFTSDNNQYMLYEDIPVLINMQFMKDTFFNYRPNPIVTNVYNRETILRGGTNITIEGRYLNSVETFKVLVYMKIDGILVSNFSSVCAGSQSPELSNVSCPLPLLESNLNTNTINALLDQATPECIACDPDNIQVPARRRLLNVPRPEPSASFTLGLGMDNHNVYEDLEKSHPEFSTLLIYHNPIIETFVGKQIFRTFWPVNHDAIDIKGERMVSPGLRESEYRVKIGNGDCEGLVLTSNLLTCRPPAKNPGSAVGNEHTEVLLYIGSDPRHYDIGLLDYQNWHQYLPYQILTVLLCLVIFLTIIIVIVVVHKRQRRPDETTRPRDQATLPQSMSGSGQPSDGKTDDYDNSHPSMSRSNAPDNQGYLQPVEKAYYDYAT